MGCILTSVVNGSDPAAAFAGVLAQSNAWLSIGGGHTYTLLYKRDVQLSTEGFDRA